jgi:hypothetical protein
VRQTVREQIDDEALSRDVEQLARRLRRARSMEGADSRRRDLAALRDRVRAIEAIDFLSAAGGHAVGRVAEIVHHVDLKDQRYQPPEATTIGALVEGIRQACSEDADALQQGMAMFDALHRSFDTAGATPRVAGKPPSSRRARSTKRRPQARPPRYAGPSEPDRWSASQSAASRSNQANGPCDA